MSYFDNLILLANYLDQSGFKAEADYLDDIIKLAFSRSFPLMRGDKDETVKKAQEKLLQYGYHMDAGADGDFGEQTEDAIKEFQTQNGFSPTGELSKNEFDLLVSGSPKKAPKKRVIAAIGDSITAGGYARLLKTKVPNSRIHTFGYGGKGSKFIANKLDLALAKNPDDIIILAGVNDIASGRSITHIMDNLEDMYNRSRMAGARIIAVKILPWHGRRSSKGKLSSGENKRDATGIINSEIESYIRSLPSEEGHMVIDGDPMLSDDPSKYEMSKRYSGDGVHPNKRGKELLAQMIADKAFSEEQIKAIMNLRRLCEEGSEEACKTLMSRESVNKVTDKALEEAVLSGRRVFRKGDKNKKFVKSVQTMLENFGYTLDVYGADGILGDETESAIISFQENNGIKGSGEINRKTLSKLKDSNAKRNNKDSQSDLSERKIKGREKPSSIEIERLFKLTQAEVGGQGSFAQQAFMETVFNRAAYRGVSINRVVSNNKYYSPIMKLKSKNVDDLRPVSSATKNRYNKILEKVLSGSNITNGATHNASAGVARAWESRYDGQPGSRIDISGNSKNPSISREFGESGNALNRRSETFYSKTYEQKKLKDLGIIP